MILSPMYLFTMPPCRSTISVASVKYSHSNSAICSGWSGSETGGKPRMRAKSIVTSRRPGRGTCSPGSRTTARSTSAAMPPTSFRSPFIAGPRSAPILSLGADLLLHNVSAAASVLPKGRFEGCEQRGAGRRSLAPDTGTNLDQGEAPVMGPRRPGLDEHRGQDPQAAQGPEHDAAAEAHAEAPVDARTPEPWALGRPGLLGAS